MYTTDGILSRECEGWKGRTHRRLPRQEQCDRRPRSISGARFAILPLHGCVQRLSASATGRTRRHSSIRRQRTCLCRVRVLVGEDGPDPFGAAILPRTIQSRSSSVPAEPRGCTNGKYPGRSPLSQPSYAPLGPRALCAGYSQTLPAQTTGSC